MRLLSISAVLVSLFLSSAAWPDDQDAQVNSRNKAAHPSQEQVKQWIALLDSDDFTEREAATEQLAAAGIAALGELEQAARSENLEIAWRAVEAIGKMLNSKDTAQFEAARKVMAGLARAGPAATQRRAKHALQSTGDPEFCAEVKQQLAAAITAADEQETHPVIVENELVDKIKEQPGFRFAKGNRFQGFDWRKSEK